MMIAAIISGPAFETRAAAHTATAPTPIIMNGQVGNRNRRYAHTSHTEYRQYITHTASTNAAIARSANGGVALGQIARRGTNSAISPISTSGVSVSNSHCVYSARFGPTCSTAKAVSMLPYPETSGEPFR